MLFSLEDMHGVYAWSKAWRWQSAGHALPAYILLGRITGWTEDEVRNRWATDPHRAVEDAVKVIR